MSDAIHFGQLVRDRRSALGLTQAELANRAGCAPITIRKIESGSLRPSFQMAERLALSLNIPETEQLAFVRLSRQQPPKTPIPKPTPAPSEIGLPDLSGRSVKGFQLGELLGQGGFGVVYKATQPSVNRDVAVKIILPKFANRPEFIRRFESEAQLVAKLEHPHIVPLYDFWREPDAAYLIMRLLRGGSLQSRLQKGDISLQQAFKMIQQIGLALDVAHRNGVIHRDIKPANVLLDESGNAYLTDFGIAKNLEINNESQITQDGVVVGSPAYISPEQLLAEPVRPQSDIYCFGIMMYEILTGQKPFTGPTPVAYIQQHLNDPLPSIVQHIPDAPVQLEEALKKATEKKPENRFESMSLLLEELKTLFNQWGTSDVLLDTHIDQTLQPLSTQEIADLENPFLGLRPFSEADADNFYGRNALVQELLGLMSDGTDLSRLIAVVGPSGSGKSSSVKAGLMPALRQGGLPESEQWYLVDFMPSAHPWEELEAALLRIAVDPPHNMRQLLMANERGLMRVVQQLLPDDGETELVLVIDQFEEMFTLLDDEDSRMLFLDSLVTAVLDPKSRIRIVLTLRADFTDRPLQYPDFGELMRQRMVFVLPLMPHELTDAITQPVTTLGLEMEPALVTTLVKDVGEQPGMLPLLQYTLTELFERRNGRLMMLGTYHEMGGVKGSLARRADEIFERLDIDEQGIARQLFLRLITLGEGVEDTRRRVLQAELDDLQAQQVSKIHRVLEEFGRFRLLTFDQDPATRSATVEVAHEALLREWPRLRQWLTDSREDVRRQRLLADSAHQWAEADQDDSYLLRGSRLVAFESWMEDTAVALTENESTYLKDSLVARDKRQAKEEERRLRELETVQKLADEQQQRAEEQSRAAQSLRQRAYFLSGALVIAAVLAIVAFGFSRSSNSNLNLASTRESEAIANAILAETREGEALENANLALTREAEREIERQAAVFAQETAVAETNFRATAEADALEKQIFAEQQQVLAEEQTLLAVSRELSQLATSLLESDPELSMLLAMEALENTYTKQAEEVLHNGLQRSRAHMTLIDEHISFSNAIFTPDGKKFIVHSDEGFIQLRSADTGELLSSAPLSSSVIKWQMFNPTDNSIWILINQNELTDDGNYQGMQLLSWDMMDSEVQLIQTINEELPVFMEARISPDGTLLAFGNTKNEAILWDILAGEKLLTLAQFSDLAWGYSFSQDGSLLVVGGINGEVAIIDIQASIASKLPQSIFDFTFQSQEVLLQSMISPSGNLLVIQQEDVQIWDISDLPNRQLLLTIEDEIKDFAFNSDETLFISQSPIQDNGFASVWELSSGQRIFDLAGHKSAVFNAMFSSDEKHILTSSADGSVRVWDATLLSGGEVNTLFDGLAGMDFELSPNQQLLASASYFGPLTLYDRETFEVIHSFGGNENTGIYRASFHPNGTQIATVGFDQVIRIWDVDTGELLISWVGHEPGGNSGGFFPGDLDVEFSPDGTRIVTASSDGSAKVWDAETGEQLISFDEHSVGLHSVEYSNDGAMIATSSDNPENTVRVWNAETGEEIFVLNVINRAWGLNFSPDDKILITSGTAGFVTIWDLETGTELYSLPSQIGTVSDVEFMPNGNQFITNGGNNTTVWDLETGNEVKIISNNVRMFSMEVSNDGRFLYGGTNGFLYVFTLDINDTIALAQDRISRSLTNEECRRYLYLDNCSEK